LSELSGIGNAESVDVVDTYRALCLLGLGRTREAEQVLEAVATRSPLLVLSASDYSPRVVALFEDVRKKTLPAAAQRLYSFARTDYDNKNYEAAAAAFEQTVQVIGKISEDAQTPTLRDLKELAAGFLTLAEAKIAAAPAPSTPALAAPTVAAEPVAPAAPSAVFTPLDTDVTPPSVLDQALPPWTFGTQLKTGVFTGMLDIVVDEHGAVERVTVIEPVWPPYDAALLEAARKWRYTPALKGGRPVKFKRVLAIRIDPKAR
jgi:TonB family protein